MIFMNKGRLAQFSASLSCNMSAMMVAASWVWFTPILSDLTALGSPVPMSMEESSWMISTVQLGELISCFPSGFLLNRMGRKTVLLASFPMIAVSWVLILATRSLGALFAVRLLQGMAVGVVCTVAPVYVAEIAEPQIRGALCGQFQIMWLLGLLWSYCTGPFLRYDYYAYVTITLCFVFACTFVVLPESPYYLVSRKRDEEARQALLFLRTNADVQSELDSIKTCLDEGKEGSCSDLFANRSDRRMLLVVSSCCFVRYMSGGPPLTQYLTSTVAYTGSQNELNPKYVTIIICLVALAASLVSSTITDHIGRKPLLIISTVGSVIINLIASIYYALVDRKINNILNYSWIAYVCLSAYYVISNIGLSTLMQVLQAECFSSKNRGKAGAFITFLATVTTYMSLVQYQHFVDWAGMWLNFFSYAVYSLAGCIAIFSYMRETAGRSLVDIQYVSEDLHC